MLANTRIILILIVVLVLTNKTQQASVPSNFSDFQIGKFPTQTLFVWLLKSGDYVILHTDNVSQRQRKIEKSWHMEYAIWNMGKWEYGKWQRPFPPESILSSSWNGRDHSRQSPSCRAAVAGSPPGNERLNHKLYHAPPETVFTETVFTETVLI